MFRVLGTTFVVCESYTSTHATVYSTTSKAALRPILERTDPEKSNVIPDRLLLLPYIRSMFRGGLRPWCLPQRSLALQTLLVRKQDLDLLQSGGRSG